MMAVSVGLIRTLFVYMDCCRVTIMDSLLSERVCLVVGWFLACCWLLPAAAVCCWLVELILLILMSVVVFIFFISKSSKRPPTNCRPFDDTIRIRFQGSMSPSDTKTPSIKGWVLCFGRDRKIRTCKRGRRGLISSFAAGFLIKNIYIHI